LKRTTITEKTLTAILKIAKVLYEKDYFISFIEEVNKVKITDGTDTIFAQVDIIQMKTPVNI